MNDTLDSVKEIMKEIKEESHKMRGADAAIVKDTFVTASAWKSGIRKIQTKLANFY